MKQRLLYAILLLFGVFGMAKAADPSTSYIKVEPMAQTAEGAKVTVTFSGIKTGTNDITVTDESGNSLQTTTGLSILGSVVTLPVATQTAYFINFSAADVANSNPVTKQKVGITVDGKVYSSRINTNETVSSLSFTNNGELAWLTIVGSTNVESLSCSGNKLQAIPVKGNIATYNVGTQSPDGLSWDTNVDNQPSNTSFDLLYNKIKLDGNVYLSAGDGLNAYSYTNWTVKNAEGRDVAASGENTPQPASNYRYTFKDPSTGIYSSAVEYKTDLVFSTAHTDYPGVTIKGVPVKVKDPMFTVSTTTEPASSGEVSVQHNPSGTWTNVGNTSIKKGTTLQITFTGNPGYEFDKAASTFIGLKNLEWANNSNNVLTCEVTGDKNPEIKSMFKAVGHTIHFTEQYDHGSVSINIVNGKTIHDGEQVPHGSQIQIVPSANPGFEVASITYSTSSVNNNTISDDGQGRYIVSVSDDLTI